ncbi:DNA repair protein RadC [Oxalobacteraceae bacterium GrIS 2.11]
MARHNITRKALVPTIWRATEKRAVNWNKHHRNRSTIRPSSSRTVPTNLEDNIIDRAFTILAGRLQLATISLSTKKIAEQYLLHKLMTKEREIFGAIWLDVKNRVLACEELSQGTLNHARIYPREIIKSALAHNAASVILYHNHPSGDATPSTADKELTAQLKTTLKSVDVQILDHLIIAGTQTFSFAERGEL